MPTQYGHTLRWLAGFLVLLWLAHAAGYLVHEYAHSFTAWILHYKDNPLALHYGHLSWKNIAYQSDIEENVDYDPIFAAGRGPLAALIAVAGVLLGNGICYLLSRSLYLRAKAQNRKVAALFLYLFCMMNVGNFISYVPNRTFTTHADMATVERGLGLSPWWIALVLGVPFCLAVLNFLMVLLPGAMTFFSPHSAIGQFAWLLLSTGTICLFYGQAGYDNHGEVSHRIASTWIYVVFPLSVLVGWSKSRKIVGARA